MGECWQQKHTQQWRERGWEGEREEGNDRKESGTTREGEEGGGERERKID